MAPILSHGQNASITGGGHCLGEINKNCLISRGEGGLTARLPGRGTREELARLEGLEPPDQRPFNPGSRVAFVPQWISPPQR